MKLVMYDRSGIQDVVKFRSLRSALIVLHAMLKMTPGEDMDAPVLLEIRSLDSPRPDAPNAHGINQRYVWNPHTQQWVHATNMTDSKCLHSRFYGVEAEGKA